MGEQSASRLEGDRYQHLYSWYELLRLLEPDSPFAFGYVEHPSAGAGDDVTLHPGEGSPLATRYVQVKWHVDHREAYSFAGLMKPSASGGPSMLHKLFTSWRELQKQGPVEIWLVSNWPAGDDLGTYLQAREYMLRREFFAESPKARLGAVHEKWSQHLGATRVELRAFSQALRLRLGFASISDLEAQVDDRMGRLGLRTGEEARAVALDEVRRWIEAGGEHKRITRESLLASLEERGLLAPPEDVPAVGLWIHGLMRRTYEPPATVELDWTRAFDRDTRTVVSDDVWQRELLPELRAARERLNERPDGALIDFRGKLPLSVMLAVGASFPEVAGYRFRAEQPPQALLWRSDTPPSSRQLRPFERAGSPEGTDLLVVLALTGNTRVDVARFKEQHPGRFKTVLTLEPDAGPSELALGSAADATAFALQTKQHLRRLREETGAHTTHLILYAPATFCLFLGQRLNALGRIVTYERTQAGGYAPSLVIETG